MNYEPYLSYLAERNMSQETIYDYSNTYKRFFSVYDGMTTANIKDYLKPFKATTRGKYRVQLKGLADFHKLDIDWKRAIPQPKVHKEAPLTLSENDQKRLLKYVQRRDAKFANVIVFLIHTGLRVSEALSLTQSSLRESTTKDGKIGYYLHIKKEGGSSHSTEGRYVPLDTIARHTLDKLTLPIKFDRRRLNDMLVECRAELAMPPYTIHSFRKTFTTRSLSRGVNVIALANILGHKSPNTMLDYASKQPNTLMEAFL